MLIEKYYKLVTESLTPRQRMNSTSLPTKGHDLNIFKQRAKRPDTGKYCRVTNSYDFLKEDWINIGMSMK